MNNLKRPVHTLASALALTLLMILATGASALEAEPFSEERFQQLQEDNALVLLDVWATWCPTCKKQREVLTQYQADHPDSDLVILEVDFDNQKEWVTHFRAPRQSTLILYKGQERVWFSVAETRADAIYTALNDAAQ